MSVRDVVVNDDAYSPLSLDSADEFKAVTGDKVANISSDDFALNCSVYYGANRMSMENGAGISTESDMFGKGKTSFVVGYEESYLSGLKYANVGDVITVTTNYGEFKYKISDVSYVQDTDDYSDLGSDKLVICALTSVFSDNSGKLLCVLADKIEGEVN
jgi:sortase A